jgi:hypothetical protein
MSLFSGNSASPQLSNPATETLQLYSVLQGDELEIEGGGGDSLKITSKIMKDGVPYYHTRHLSLKREAVLLRYAVTTNENLSQLWNIGVVYGSSSTRETVEYPLQSEQDAFRFQRLVTGYTPHSRFQRVVASALEQHHFIPGKRATELNITGEAQLWSFVEPAPQETPKSPRQASRDGSSAEGRSRSILSVAPSRSGASVAPVNSSKVATVTKAKIPPLLVLFAESKASNGTTLFQMMRVNSERLFLLLSKPAHPADTDGQLKT